MLLTRNASLAPAKEEIREINIKGHHLHNSTCKPYDKFSVKFYVYRIDRLKLFPNYDNNNNNDDDDKEHVEIIEYPPECCGATMSVPLDHPNDKPKTWFDITLFNLIHMLRLDETVREEIKSKLESYIENNPRPASLTMSINYVSVYEGPISLKDDEVRLKTPSVTEKIGGVKDEDKDHNRPCNHEFQGLSILTILDIWRRRSRPAKSVLPALQSVGSTQAIYSRLN